MLPLGLGIYLFWYFFSSMSEKSKELFFKALSEVNYFWIILSMIFLVLAHYSRAYRWKYVLEPLGYETNSMNRFYAVLIGYMVNLTIPRAGEASRVVMIGRSDRVPFTAGIGTIISERVIDMISLALITIITFVIGQKDFLRIKALIETNFGGTKETQSNLIWIFLGLGMICLLLLLIKKIRKRIFKIIGELFQSSLSIFKTKNPGGYIFHSLIIWLCYIVSFMLPFYAFESTENLPMSCVLLAFIAGTVGISLTNGGVGSYPLLVGLVVGFFLVDKPAEEANAIGNALGLIIWSTQTFLVVVLGLISWWLLPVKK
ncbi:MAG: lysylphosphatidylglycerol synthase transmembrane domain-containing protein [Bacteroidota bacterium]